MNMMSTWKQSISVLSGLGAVLLIAGCAFRPVVDETRFYVLSTAEYAPNSAAEPDAGSVMGIARVRVARYLDAPGIAIREGGHRIVYSQSHRWAESMEHGVARVLAESLSQEAAVAHVVAYPAQRRPLPDYELHVSVLRAEGVIDQAGPRVVFHASWELRGELDDEVVASGLVKEESLPWDGDDFKQLAASLSRGTFTLARQVAGAVGGEG